MTREFANNFIQYSNSKVELEAVVRTIFAEGRTQKSTEISKCRDGNRKANVPANLKVFYAPE